MVTRNDRSAGSVIPVTDAAMAVRGRRLTRHGEALRVQYRGGAEKGAMSRLAFLDMPVTVSIGPMACSPLGAGLDVRFSHFAIGPAISRELHEEES